MYRLTAIARFPRSNLPLGSHFKLNRSRTTRHRCDIASRCQRLRTNLFIKTNGENSVISSRNSSRDTRSSWGGYEPDSRGRASVISTTIDAQEPDINWFLASERAPKDELKVSVT